MTSQLEQICLETLEGLLSATARTPTLTGTTALPGRVSAIHSGLAELRNHLPAGWPGDSIGNAGSAFLGLHLNLLFEQAALAEGFDRTPCERQKAIVRSLFDEFRDKYMS